MQVPDALNIVTVPVPEPTEHAFEPECEKMEVPSPALATAVRFAVDPYLKTDGDPEMLSVRVALAKVKVSVLVLVAVS